MVQNIRQNVLIVTTDAETTRLVLQTLAGLAIRGLVVADMVAARQRVEFCGWDLVITDLEPAQADGFELLKQVKADFPELPVLVLGPDGSAKAAVQAMRAGGSDFLPRPLEPAALGQLISSLLPSHAVALAAADAEDTRCLYQIAGASPKLSEVIRLARKVATTSMPVLILGESGTGKELLSYLIHRCSQRARGPYIRVNCAALSESLLESELFGHERGAFTGAIALRKGRFERAHGGTLLLDEISETGPRLQAELLRVLEQQDFERVGGTEPIRVNVRLIATTNRCLVQEVQQGRFRRDLYYRIKGIHLVAPPLRERPEDIPVLVWHFVNLYAREVRRRITELDSAMLELFARCDWPGNVRQLRNVVRSALVLGSGQMLSLKECPHIQQELEQALKESPAMAQTLSLVELERQAILEALRRTNSHQVKAARLLGITDRTLREKLKRYRQAQGLGGPDAEPEEAAGQDKRLFRRPAVQLPQAEGAQEWL